MTISALPTPPSRSDSPGDFATKADAFLGALPTFATEANALAGDVNADAAAAAGSASTAATQAGIATTQAGIATTQAGIAAGHASDALGHANTASGAAASAIASFDQFDARYLGAKASDPSTDNEGNPLVAGALYYKTGEGMRVWNGSVWSAAYIPTTGVLTVGDIGTTVQAYDADLTSWGAIAPTAKQDTLVSGTNIKTINSTSLLGSGNIALVAATSGTASGLTLNDGYTEEVFAVTGTTPALSPANGSIQTWTLSGNSTPTAGTWAAGQSITLMVDDGSAATITWTSLAVTWKTGGGSAPTLNTSGYTVIALWKVGTTIYGARVGDA